MSLSDMFTNSFLEENFALENGVTYNIKIDTSPIFKAKLVSYARQGLKIEKIAVPHSISGAFVDVSSSDNGKYIFYTSSPEYLIDDTMSAFDLVLSFRNWIARFLHSNKTEEEYNRMKENKQLGVEVRNKIRKDEHWTEEQGELFAKAYYMSWKLSDTLGPEKMNNLSVVIIRQAAETGQLYGSVTMRDICEAIHDAGFKVERQQIVMGQPFKNLGIFDVRLSLHPDVSQSVRVNIARSAEEAKRSFKKKADAEAKAEKETQTETVSA